MDYNLPNRVEDSHKGTYGRVLCVCGSDYMRGAAYLSSVSALKIGCGYSVLCSTEKVIDSVSARSAAIVFAPLCDLEKQIDLADVIVLGCGLSTDDMAVEIFKRVINTVKPDKKIIIDADGINILAKNYDLYKEKNFTNVILTPHPKEASRLLGIDANIVLSDLKISAMNIAKKFGSVAVLKTHNTVVSSADGRYYTNTTGNNSMAKAGSGDVLTGMIAGLTSQGIGTFEAAALGVLLHGLCGDLAKEKLTEYSVMAEDLISFIPDAIKFYRSH